MGAQEPPLVHVHMSERGPQDADSTQLCFAHLRGGLWVCAFHEEVNEGGFSLTVVQEHLRG